MIAAGERAFFYNFNTREFSAINLESPWAKFSCGARAFYCHVNNRVFSLKPPPEGICVEKEEDVGEFEEWFRRAGKFDSGAIRLGDNPQSEWKRYTCGGRAFCARPGNFPP